MLRQPRDDHVGVLVAITLAVNDSPAWRGLVLEAAAGVHVFPSLATRDDCATTERT
jgi:hypothetical protein